MRSKEHPKTTTNILIWLVGFLYLLSTEEAQVHAGDKAIFATPTQNNANQLSLRQSVCHRYIETTNGTSELRSALSGMELRPILTVSQFFHYSEENGIDDEDPGLLVRLLDELASRANFTWRQSFAISYGPELNSTWTDMLQLYTEMFDVSIDYWDRSTDRLNRGIAFLDEWFSGNIILIEKVKPPKDTDKVNYTNYLRPFTANVWYATLATIVVSAFIYQWLEYIQNKRDERSFSHWFQDSLYLSSMNFTQNYSYEPVSLAGRIFCFSMAIWAMVMGATYTANLASLFVEQKVGPAKIQDIDEAIRKQVKICTWSGTNADQYVKRRYPQAIRIPKETELEAYQGLHTGECGLTLGAMASWLGHKNDKDYNIHCDLEWVGRTVEEVSSSFAVKADPALKCTNLIRDVLNYHLSAMQSDRTLNDLWDAHYEANKNIDCQNQQSNFDNIDENERNRRRLHYLKAGRLLKGGGGGGGAGNSAAAAAGAMADEGDPESSSLTMNAMAGTFVLHAVLSGLAILVGFISNYQSHKEGKRLNNGMNTKIVPQEEDITEETHHIAGSTLASGTICNHGSSDAVDTLFSKNSSLNEQLEALYTTQKVLQSTHETLHEQQEQLTMKMNLVVSLLTKIQGEVEVPGQASIDTSELSEGVFVR